VSALPRRENLRRLVELVPERDLEAAERVLQGLIALDRDPLRAALDSAPEADGELAPGDLEAIEAGRRAKREGRVVSRDEARRRLGL
jgi:hypothetical protein